MKNKTLLILILTLFLTVIVSCNKNPIEEDKRIEEAYDALNITGDLANVKDSLTLAKTGLHDTKITWTSSNEDIVSNDGKVNRPSFEEGDIKVVLTATLNLEEQTKAKKFTLLVIKDEKEEEVIITDPSINFIAASPYESIGGSISLVSPSADEDTMVYYVLLKTKETLVATDIINPSEEIAIKGSQKGGFRGFIIEDLEPSINYYIYVVGVLEEEISEVYETESLSSDLLYWGGENPDTLGHYPIYDLRDLEEFNRGYNLGEYTRYSNVVLMADIDMSETYGPDKKKWAPLNQPGDDADGLDPAQTEYHAIFDGNGHTINGLYIDSDEDFVGFFKKVDAKENYGTWDPEKDAGQIINLTFTNVEIIARYNENRITDEGEVYSARGVGVVAGFFRGGLVDNVKVIGGSVKRIGEVSGESQVGGLLGWVQSHGWTGDSRGDTSVTISNSMTDITVEGFNNVGGLVGLLDDGWTSGAHEMKISNVYSLGNTIGNDKVGGIIGTLRGVIENAVAYGDVTATNGTASGVVGYFRGLRRGSDRYQSKIENIFAMNKNVSGNNYGEVIYSTKTSLTNTLDPKWFPHPITVEGLYLLDEQTLTGTKRVIPTLEGETEPFYEVNTITKQDFITYKDNILTNWHEVSHEVHGQILVFENLN